MGDRKAPTPVPTDQVRPEPPPAPPLMRAWPPVAWPRDGERSDLRIVSNGLAYRIEQLVTRRRWFRAPVEAWTPLNERDFGNFRDGNRIREWGHVSSASDALRWYVSRLAAEERGWQPVQPTAPQTPPVCPPNRVIREGDKPKRKGKAR